MSTSGTTVGAPAAPGRQSAEQSNYLNHSRGIGSWLLTLDHKRIGVMYLISILTAFFLGGVFALLVRTELIAPGETMMDPDT